MRGRSPRYRACHVPGLDGQILPAVALVCEDGECGIGVALGKSLIEGVGEEAEVVLVKTVAARVPEGERAVFAVVEVRGGVRIAHVLRRGVLAGEGCGHMGIDQGVEARIAVGGVVEACGCGLAATLGSVLSHKKDRFVDGLLRACEGDHDRCVVCHVDLFLWVWTSLLGGRGSVRRASARLRVARAASATVCQAVSHALCRRLSDCSGGPAQT